MLKIRKTTNYDQFFFINGNRPVRPGALIASIQEKNLLDSHPIIVTDSLIGPHLRPYGVIDGQHRLKAAQELNLPIFFIVDSKLTEKDIPVCQVENPWTFYDYLRFFENDNENYQFVRRAMDKNSLPIHFVVEKSNRSGDAYSNFRDGTFTIKSNHRALKERFDCICQLVKLARVEHSRKVHNKALRAIWSVMTMEGYNHEKMMHKARTHKTQFGLALAFTDTDSVTKKLSALYHRSDKKKKNEAEEDL